MSEQSIELCMALMALLGIASLSISVYIILRKNYRKVTSASDKVNTQTLIGMLYRGIIFFCFITNKANKFNPQENKRKFSNVLANTAILALGRELASTSCRRSEHA